jgi:hypothetical protein
MAREKTADLRIRARDESSAVLRKAKSALDGFNNAAQRSSQRREVLGARKAEIDGVRQSYVQLTADMRRLQEAQDRMRASGTANQSMLRENGEAIGLLRARARDAVQTLAQKRAEMQRLGIATQNSFAGFIRNAEAMQRQSAAATQGASASRAQSAAVKQNADELGRLTRRNKEVARSQGQMRTQIVRTTSAINAQNTAVRGRSARQNWGSSVVGEDQELMAFGLRPYQLTNLSYQVNDVVSGLMMGQRPAQIFSQQIGQIVQIFPAFARVMMGIFRFFETFWKLLGPLAAGIGVVFSVMRREAQDAGVIRQFATELIMLADGSRYAADGLAQIVTEARSAGMALSDAQSAVSTFVRAGFDQSQIGRLVEMARRLAQVTGQDVPAAAERLATAFSGGVNEVRELDREMNFLTARQYQFIRAMADSGRETQAVEVAMGILSDTIEAAANNAGEGGPWSTAFRNLGDAWNYALNWFARTAPIQAAIWAINQLGEAVAALTNLLPGTGGGTTFSASPTAGRDEIDLAREQLEIAQEIARLRAEQNRQGFLGDNSSTIAQLQSEYQQLSDAIADAVLSNPRFRTPLTVPVEIEPVVTPEATSQTEEQLKDIIDSYIALNRTYDEHLDQLRERARLTNLTSREQFIESELARVRLEEQRQSVVLSDAQLQALREQAGATYDALEAERERNREARGGGGGGDPVAEERRRLEQEMNDILELRSQLLQEIAFQEAAGNAEAVTRLRTQLDGVNDSARQAIDNVIEFLGQLSGAGIEAAILNLQRIRRELQDIGQEALFTAEMINQSLAQKGANAFDRFAQAVANGENVIKSLRDAFLQFAAEFLREIAQMIIRQALLNALKGAFGGGGGGVGGIISNALNAIIRHNGGMANSGGGSKSVNPAVFAGASRFHGGGIAGLGPREVPAILLEDEEVLTADDPRHAKNGGIGSGSTVNVKNVNLFDPADMLEKALSTVAGEQVLLNHIGRNRGRYKGALG